MAADHCGSFLSAQRAPSRVSASNGMSNSGPFWSCPWLQRVRHHLMFLFYSLLLSLLFLSLSAFPPNSRTPTNCHHHHHLQAASSKETGEHCSSDGEGGSRADGWRSYLMGYLSYKESGGGEQGTRISRGSQLDRDKRSCLSLCV